MKNQPFFIFGPQKSGTTLLTTVLTQNPEIRIATDSVFLNMFSGWLNEKLVDLSVTYHKSVDDYVLGNGVNPDVLTTVPTYDDVKWFISTMYNRYFAVSTQRLQKLLQMNEDPERIEFLRSEELIPYTHGQSVDPVPLFMISKANGTWRDLFNEVIKQIADAPFEQPLDEELALYGEKTPGHIRFAELIDKAYPTSPFLFVIRNPIANIASYYKRDNSGFGIGGKNDLTQAINTYANYINPFIKFYQKRPYRFEIMRYEDLVATPEPVIERLSLILGKEFKGVDHELSPTIKQDYVGTKIDPEREKSAYSILSLEQQKHVMEAFSFIFENFYPEFTLATE